MGAYGHGRLSMCEFHFSFRETCLKEKPKRVDGILSFQNGYFVYARHMFLDSIDEEAS